MRLFRRARLLTWVLAVGSGSCASAESNEAPVDDDVADDLGDDDLGDDSDGDGDGGEADGGSLQLVFTGEGVDCGEERCRTAEVGDFMFTGCCASEEASTCGLDLSGVGVLIGLVMPGCEPLDRAGSEDDSCDASPPLQAAIPDVDGISLPGCCQAQGQCGYFANLQGIGFGCVSPTRFGFDEGAPCDFEP